MTKEMTPLEDLKWLCENGYIQYNNSWQEAPYIIEAIDNIEKSLKALEIIKEKKVDISLLFQVFDNEKRIPKPLFYYNNHVDNYRHHYSLTKEEYDLLKEVLL